MARDDVSATAAKRTPGKRLALYWIGGFLAFGLLVDIAGRMLEPEGHAKLQAEREQRAELVEARAESAEEASQRKAAEKRANGEHCVSGWDGANRSLKDMVKGSTRNPDSFEHIDTRIGAAVASETTGRLEHPVIMRFRAENGFGGMNIGVAVASVDNASCNATLISLTER